MKFSLRWAVFIAIILVVCSPITALEELTDFVNDEAGVISPAYEQQISSLLYELKINTSVEMAVATVNTTEGVPIEEYSLNLAHDVLGEKEKDNGLLILLAVEDRAYRIEVGYGLEPVINDALAGRIGREVMASGFAEGNYEQGLLDGVKALDAVIRGDESWETIGSDASAGSTSNGSVMLRLGMWGFFLFIIIIGNVVASYKYAKKKNNEKLKKGEKPGAGDFIAAMVIASMFGRGGRGRGGFGGSGGIGGFGGFGGGGFGGGGFSGRF